MILKLKNHAVVHMREQHTCGASDRNRVGMWGLLRRPEGRPLWRLEFALSAVGSHRQGQVSR